MVGARVYGLHGLRIRSALPIAGFALAGDAYDVDIRWGPTEPVPAESPTGRLLVLYSDHGGWRYAAVDDGSAITLRVPGICDFVLDRPTRTIECRPDPRVDRRMIAILLAGLVLAFVLILDGHCVLHASAVEIEGRAVAFAGASGSGKSTLAALLCGMGARLVSDDVLRLALEPNPMCVAGVPELRLRPGSAWAVDHYAVLPPSRETVDGRLAIAPAPCDGPVPIAVIVLPRLERRATAVEVRRLVGAEPLLRLAELGRVPGWRDRGILSQQFDGLAAIATEVPVVEALIPWGPGMHSTIAASLADLAHRSM